MNKRPKFFLVVWRGREIRYETIEGEDFADACVKAGWLPTAVESMESHHDITQFVNSKVMRKATVEVEEYVATYYWKRESIAKILKMVPNAFNKIEAKGTMTGYTANDLTRFLIEKHCKEFVSG